MTQSAGDMLVHTLIEILGVEEPARLPRGVLVGINSVTRCLESGCRAVSYTHLTLPTIYSV